LRRRLAGTTDAGFTLAEVLAALLFLAIVIPVAMQGLQIANRAGVFSARKATAARIAERLLNEQIITGDWQLGTPGGTYQEGAQTYRWNLDVEPWNQGALRLVTVDVTYAVQGREYDVRLSTVVDTTVQ
jgi:Tfp pilus assembly protein PilV